MNVNRCSLVHGTKITIFFFKYPKYDIHNQCVNLNDIIKKFFFFLPTINIYSHAKRLVIRVQKITPTHILYIYIYIGLKIPKILILNSSYLCYSFRNGNLVGEISMSNLFQDIWGLVFRIWHKGRHENPNSYLLWILVHG